MQGEKRGNRELSVEERQEIVTLRLLGFSLRNISTKVGVSLATVLYTVNRKKDHPIEQNQDWKRSEELDQRKCPSVPKALLCP